MERIKIKISKLLPDPEDVYSAHGILYVFSHLFGLASYAKKAKNEGQIYVFSSILAAKTALQAAMLCTGYYFLFLRGSEANRSMSGTGKYRVLQDILVVLLSVTEMIIECVLTKKLIKVFANIKGIDEGLYNCGMRISYKRIYAETMWNVVLILLLYATAVFAYIYLIHNSFQFPYNVIYASVSYIPYIVSATVVVQYVYYLRILKVKFRLLNEYLRNFLHDERTTSATSKTDLRALTGLHLMVEKIADLHMRLVDTANVINHAYCVQLLLLITISFVGTVLSLFELALNFSKLTKSTDEENYDFLFTIWVCSNVFALIWVVFATNNLCQEGNKCPRLLHRIRNKTSDMDLQETVENYALKMFHDRLQFTVCELFPLDNTLLHTIVAGVTTYLVILIQFSDSSIISGPSLSKKNHSQH